MKQHKLWLRTLETYLPSFLHPYPVNRARNGIRSPCWMQCDSLKLSNVSRLQQLKRGKRMNMSTTSAESSTFHSTFHTLWTSILWWKSLAVTQCNMTHANQSFQMNFFPTTLLHKRQNCFGSAFGLLSCVWEFKFTFQILCFEQPYTQCVRLRYWQQIILTLMVLLLRLKQWALSPREQRLDVFHLWLTEIWDYSDFYNSRPSTGNWVLEGIISCLIIL